MQTGLVGTLVAHHNGTIDEEESHERQNDRSVETALGQDAQDAIAQQLGAANELKPQLKNHKSFNAYASIPGVQDNDPPLCPSVEHFPWERAQCGRID